MIEFTYSVNANLTAKFECGSVRDTIEFLTQMDKVFRADTRCGFCETDNIRIRMRDTRDGYKYYELFCCNPECGARLPFHENKNAEKTLYVVQSEGGKPLPNRGWEKWWERSGGEKAGGPAGETRDTGEPRDEEVPQPRRR